MGIRECMVGVDGGLLRLMGGFCCRWFWLVRCVGGLCGVMWYRWG